MELFETTEISTHVPKTNISAEVVKAYEEKVGLTYPALILGLKSETVEEHRLKSLKNLLGADFSELRYDVYLATSDGMAQLGSVDSVTLRTLLTNELFRVFDIAMYLTEIRGKHLLALCG